MIVKQIEGGRVGGYIWIVINKAITLIAWYVHCKTNIQKRFNEMRHFLDDYSLVVECCVCGADTRIKIDKYTHWQTLTLEVFYVLYFCSLIQVANGLVYIMIKDYVWISRLAQKQNYIF